MKKQILSKFLATLFIASIGLAATSALAGPDLFQQQLNRQLVESQKQLKAAKAARDAEERQKLMAEHMKSMQEVMEKLQAMKPKEGMSMKEHEDWINEHLKLMEKVMGQMMSEHHVLMGSGEPK